MLHKKNDVRKVATPFRIRFEPNARLLTQRPDKLLIHHRETLNNLLED